MSPVAGLVLLLASSYVSSLVTPKLDSDTSIASYGTDEELAKPGGLLEKLESCPADVDYPKCNHLIKVKPECSQDKDCKGKRKCCTSGCTQRCLLPLQPKLNPCPCFDDSMCIYVKPAPYECHSDSQCQGTDRCCFSKCRYQCTSTVTVKPGQCPAPKKKIIATACAQDSDCTGDKKCCEQKGLKCVKPEKEHPGVCPTGLQDLSCSYLNKTLCSRDSDCLPEQKCCLSHGNILQCTAVKNEKPGSCPITRARCLLPFVKPLCNSDRDCLGQQKCCTPLCLRQCTDPVPKVPEKQCPVVATLIKCQPPYPPAECDDEDRKCLPGQKCCDVGCRMACTDV